MVISPNGTPNLLVNSNSKTLTRMPITPSKISPSNGRMIGRKMPTCALSIVGIEVGLVFHDTSPQEVVNITLSS